MKNLTTTLILLALAGCTTDTHEQQIINLTRDSGNCAERMPVHAVAELCNPYGGVAKRVEQGPAVEVFCRGGYIAWGRWDAVEVSQDPCQSPIARDPNSAHCRSHENSSNIHAKTQRDTAWCHPGPCTKNPLAGPRPST